MEIVSRISETTSRSENNLLPKRKRGGKREGKEGLVHTASRRAGA